MADYLHYRNLRSTERLGQEPDDLDHHYQDGRRVSRSQEKVKKQTPPDLPSGGGVYTYTPSHEDLSPLRGEPERGF
jgi:hypothetical protein